MSTAGWVIIAALAWLGLAGLVAVVLGRVIARRDRQVPQSQQFDATRQLPRKRLRSSLPEYWRGRHQ